MRKLLLPFAALFVLTSCRYFGGEQINGNGNIVTAQRNVGSFNSIEAGGAFEVRIRQDAGHTVRVETDENLFEFLDVFTDGNTLVVRPKQGHNLDPSKAIIVYASAPEFKALDASGATKIIGDAPITGNELELGASGASEISLDVNVSKLQADLSGASTLQLRGSSSTMRTEASGSSSIKCMDLATEETTLDLSGASNAEVSANRQLNIDASGASDVRYRGNASINQKSSGASSVQKI